MDLPLEWFKAIYSMSNDEKSCRFQYLGQGISRVVYAINDKYVIKVAKNLDGIYQSRVEKYVYKHTDSYLKDYLCPILWYKPKMIVMPRAENLSYKLSSYDYMNTPIYNIISFRNSEKLFKDLHHFAKHYNLYYDDILSPSSWGFLDGKPVLIDYGCTDSLDKRYL